jgi:hypothetical protein
MSDNNVVASLLRIINERLLQVMDVDNNRTFCTKYMLRITNMATMRNFEVISDKLNAVLIRVTGGCAQK